MYDVEKRGNVPIYEYLYKCIRNDIVSGRIRNGEKLLSKRRLARQEGVALITVENAYEQLLVEGYIESRERSGYYVSFDAGRFVMSDYSDDSSRSSNGNIYLKVNVIEKYDICRVVFNISDTGRGMPIEQINEIISATGELEKSELENLEKREFNVKVCQKVMKIMGGNLMIKSNIGEGTDVILTIDQRVHHEKENSILTAYENDIANYRKVLIVCQDKNIINAIKRKLNANNITSSVLYYGMDAVDKIKSGKKYDFILVEDEMKEMTGFMTFKEMQKVKDFKIPTIVMLKKDKDNIKEHFIEDGFKDYLLVDMIDSELDRIIERF